MRHLPKSHACLRTCGKLGILGAFAVFACSLPTESEPDYQGSNDDLIAGVDKNGLFQTREIRYCFPDPGHSHANWERRKQEFIASINATWQAVGVLNILPANCGPGVIPIHYSEDTGTGGYALGMGRYSQKVSMDVQFINGNTYPFGMNTYHSFVAVHEMGHVLGFRHEQDRNDSTCHTSQDFSGTGIILTGYDPNSVMNYCNKQRTELTELDKQGFRTAYGFLNPGGAPVSAISRHSGRCMDVASSGTADGTKIQLWGCNNTGAQKYALRDVGGGIVNLVNTNSGKCVDVSGASKDDGANVHLWTCNGTGAQTFRRQSTGDGYVALVNTNSGKCLDAAGWGTQDGTNIIQWSCHFGTNQQWRLQ